VLNYKGRPIVIVKPGRYWNFSLTHAWFKRNLDLTSVNQLNGLTFAQVGQSEAMVCLDPQNQVFIVRNGGFAAYGNAGTYKVVDIVDTLNLGEEYAVRETDVGDGEAQGRLLGYKKEILHNVVVGDRCQRVTIATFFNVPAQNTVVIQNGQSLRAFSAGQHVIVNPRCTFRGFFTLGERQKSFRTQPAYTLEGVPVVLHVNLRYRVVDAIELTKSYENAFQALKNPAQSAVNAVVSRLSYQQFMRAKSLSGDVPDVEHMSWLEAFKAECMNDLASHAIEYGVKVLSFDVLDRRLEGKLGDDLEKQAEAVLKNQMASTQVALQNKIKTETEQGLLDVAKVRAQQVQTEAQTEYLRRIKAADAEAETVTRLAHAHAEANKIETDQKAKAIEQIAAAKARASELEGTGYASVTAPHAQRVQLERIELEKFSSLGSKATVFVGTSNGSESGVRDGYQWASGLSLASKQK
jgi:regulator of protease activity HflC (stomatin/prohibitin superfamily)